MLALPSPGPQKRTSTWFQTQTFNAFNPPILPTYKPSNSQTLENVKHSNPTSLELSNFRSLKISNLQPPKVWIFSNFQALNLSNFLTFKLTGLQIFELEPEGCSVNPYEFCSGPSPCSLTQCVAVASNFQAGSPFILSNSKLQTRAHFKTRNSQTLELQTLHSPNFTNFQTLQSRPTYNTFKHAKIRVPKAPLVTPLWSLAREPSKVSSLFHKLCSCFYAYLLA